jgi:hypothetical protein
MSASASCSLIPAVRIHMREALSSAWPTPQKKLPPRLSVLDPFRPTIDAVLQTSLDAGVPGGRRRVRRLSWGPGQGVPTRDTMEILGHSRIAVTLGIYTGADDVSRREAIELLNRLFEGRSA